MEKVSKFKALLKKHNVKQVELAKKCGVHQTRISQWCCGDGKPSLSHAMTIAKYLGVSIDEVAKCFK